MSKLALLPLFVVLGCFLSCNSPATAPSSKTTASAAEFTKDPAKVVEAFEKTLREMPQFQCDVELAMHVKADGMDNRMVSDYTVRVEKPNRWAIVKKSGMLGGTSVSDGKQVTNYVPLMQSYSVEELPEDWVDNLPATGPAETMGMMGPAAFAASFMGHGLSEWLLAGVTKSEHVGSEKIDGTECEHYHFTQDNDMEWDLWVELGKHVLFRRFKMEPDMSAAGGQMAGMQMSIELDFTNWDTAAKLADADFVFEPPADAKLVDDLFARPEPEPHVLVGEDAPTFEVRHLNGSDYSLADELGGKVIVLDFWATWCGPCTMALPGLAEMAKDFAGQDVAVYAVNQQEETGVIEEFLAEEKLDLSVLLDSDGTIGEMYAVQGIPMTVVIGKDKRVQVVHVGYSPGLEKKLAKEVEQLLAGEDLATATREKAEASAVPVEEHGTESLWTLDGSYTSVAVDPTTKVIYALHSDGKLVQVSDTGEVTNEIELEETGRTLRLGNLVGSEAPEFVMLVGWADGVTACDREGKLLWTYPQGHGVDDVACHDLNGDGIDEVIIGYNGGTGLHVLDNQGELLWKTTSIGNVWHVTAGNYLSDDAAQVVSTSAQGKLHVFSATGEPETSHDVSVYANMVRLIQLDGQPLAHALVGGSSDDEERLLLVDDKGREKWSIVLPSLETAHIDSMAVNSRTGHTAVGMRGGLAHVVDVQSGKIIASVAKQGESPDVALLARDGQPLVLLVATGNGLNTFNMVPTTENAELETE